jgi:hypothetical protein
MDISASYIGTTNTAGHNDATGDANGVNSPKTQQLKLKKKVYTLSNILSTDRTLIMA